MPGKFLNEITADKPAKDDLGLFFDKSKNTTAQSSLVDIVAAGLDLTSGKAGEAPVVIETLNPDGTKTQTLGWGKTGGSAGTLPARPANSTDLIITHDPSSGTDGAATPAQVLTAGLPAGGNAGDALTLTSSGLAWGSSLPVSTTADKGKQLTVQADGKVAWSSDSSELPAITLGSQILATKADKSGVEWAPIEKELPDFTLKPAGSRLAINSTKTGVEWVNPPAELPAALGTAGQILLVNSTATNPVWQYGLQMPSAAPGTSLTIRAASANALGKGGDLVLQAGAQNASGGDGVVSVRQPTGGSGTAEVFSIKNASGASIFSQFGTGDMTIGNGALYQNNGINLYHSNYPGISFSNSSTTASKSCLINVEGATKIFSISTRNNAGYAVSIGTKPDTNGQLAVHATGVNIANAAAFNGNGGSALFIESFSTSKNAVVVDGLPGQTADLLLFRKQNTITAGDVTNLCSVSKEGAFKPAAMADSAAPNNSMYFSTTANKLVYKDASGLVNNLY